LYLLSPAAMTRTRPPLTDGQIDLLLQQAGLTIDAEDAAAIHDLARYFREQADRIAQALPFSDEPATVFDLDALVRDL
jgi:hypothetical protein